MNKDSYHILADGTKVMHKDTHNAYGHMMSMATYKGLYARDNGN